MRKRMGKLQRIAVWIVLIVSTLIFLYPNFKQLQLKWKAAEDIAGDEKLWDDMETYNEKLRKDGQELTDCWSYEQTSMSEEQELKEGDVIEVGKSHLNTKIMKLNRMSFVEVLHNKMN